MDRREALKLTATVLGGSIVGSQIFLGGCSSKAGAKNLISDEDVKLLDEIGEIILPETEGSPGAKAAEIGGFMKNIVTDCYSESEQKVFVNGLKNIRNHSDEEYGKSFMELTASEKFNFVVQLNESARKEQDDRSAKPHYFTMIKQLTLWGYFTSEPGCTQALRYIQTPGRYEGCIPYNPGDKAWAL